MSYFFSTKRNYNEIFIHNKIQSHGESDAYSSKYDLDFKLLVDEEVMRERYKNLPDYDYSLMSEGFVFSNDKDSVSEVPENNLLEIIRKTTLKDIQEGTIKESTVVSLIKNLEKNKNLFLYYPYEYVNYKLFVEDNVIHSFETYLYCIFETVLKYRSGVGTCKDTFICIKVNQFFLIMEWDHDRIVFRDKVEDWKCATYRELKTYSIC